jgi:hypothetical protein
MRKYGLIGGAISIACFIGVASIYLHARRPAATNPPRIQHALSPYDLSADDLVPLKTEATGGDCKAAEILTRYYFDVAQDPYGGGLKWVRVAAKNCPDAGAKVELAVFLMHSKNDPKTAAEIADLIVQIQKTNPSMAAELKYELGSKGADGWRLVP